jgi:hypothetical protein
MATIRYSVFSSYFSKKEGFVLKTKELAGLVWFVTSLFFTFPIYFNEILVYKKGLGFIIWALIGAIAWYVVVYLMVFMFECAENQNKEI